MTKIQLNWRTTRAIRDIKAHIVKSMAKIAAFLERDAKQRVSRGNTTGLHPSRPGEPPKVVSGTLRANIAWEVSNKTSSVTVFLGVSRGPADRYAPLLESEGIRDGTTRPFLRPTVLKNRVRILKMLE
jgi:hypothetical protein